MEALSEIGVETIRSGSLVGLGFAFLFGLISFLSPCVLPMAPPYLAYIGGTTLDQISGQTGNIDRQAARRVMLAAVFFVLGLGTVFVALGVGMASAGGAPARLENRAWHSVRGADLFVRPAFLGLAHRAARRAAALCGESQDRG